MKHWYKPSLSGKSLLNEKNMTNLQLAVSCELGWLSSLSDVDGTGTGVKVDRARRFANGVNRRNAFSVTGIGNWTGVAQSPMYLRQATTLTVTPSAPLKPPILNDATVVFVRSIIICETLALTMAPRCSSPFSVAQEIENNVKQNGLVIQTFRSG